MECLKNSLQISALIILKVKLASSAHLNCFGGESGCISLKGLLLIPAASPWTSCCWEWSALRDFQEMGFCPGLITLPCSSVLPLDYIMMLMLNLNWAFTFKSVSLNFLIKCFFSPSPARKVDLTNERSKVNRLRGCGHGSDGKIPCHHLIACVLILEAYMLEKENWLPQIVCSLLSTYVV